MRENPYNEYFLEERYNCFSINLELPLRLQKRALLKKLGFPIDKKLKSCSVGDLDKVNNLFDRFIVKGPFLIIVSEKPMRTSVPQLFKVIGVNKVIWRDDYCNVKKINRKRALEIIENFNLNSWLEFGKEIWSPEIIAGRLLCHSAFEQEIEVQKGVKPSKMASDRQAPIFFGWLKGFTLPLHGYNSCLSNIKKIGYDQVVKKEVMSRLCENLKKHKWAFRELNKIANYPTLEFSYDEKKDKLTVIDIDWPQQWIK